MIRSHGRAYFCYIQMCHRILSGGKIMSRHPSLLFFAPDCPPNQFDLPLPHGVEDNLTPEQAAKVSKVKVKFAHGVGELLTKSFGEVSAVLDEKPTRTAPAPRPSTK